jgi:DNA topoisomerase-3
MERGQISRLSFMRDIAEMTERMVRKAKEYDRDTIPGDYVTLTVPCPNCGGVVKENYRRYACTGSSPAQDSGCGFSFTKTPAGRTFELPEVELFLKDKAIGPLEGFRSKAGWPFSAELALKFNEEERNWKLEFDFGDPSSDAESGELVDFESVQSLGPCPKCGAAVSELGKNYVCQNSVPTHSQTLPSCNFKSGTVILQQTISPQQMGKLLANGKTDLLDKFVSMRTRRPFKAYLSWDAAAGKVNFEFEPTKYRARQASGTDATRAGVSAATQALAAESQAVAKAAKKLIAKKSKTRTPAAAGKQPSAALAAVIGNSPVSRPQAIQKVWAYVKEKGLQDTTDKRTIHADLALTSVFGKPLINMFELAGLLGKHLA